MNKIKWSLISIAAMGFLGACISFFAYLMTPNSNYCVADQPRIATSCYISHPGILEGGVTRYTCEYRGTTKMSGEACALDVLVTLSEYERVMYGAVTKECCR